MAEKPHIPALRRFLGAPHALRGLRLFFTGTPNARIHALAAIAACILGFTLGIAKEEWLALVLVIGLVFLAEAFNSAIETDINLTSPDFHPFARDTKDIAAGAVLISAVTALVIGLIIFLPHIAALCGIA